MAQESSNLKSYKILSQYKNDIYFYCLSVLGKADNAKNATCLIFEEAIDKVSKSTNVNELLFKTAADICSRFEEYEIILPNSDIEDLSNEAALYYHILSLPINDRINIFSKYFAKLDNYPIYADIEEMAGGVEKLQYKLDYLCKNTNVPKIILPEKMHIALVKNKNNKILTSVATALCLMGIIFIILGIASYSLNDNKSQTIPIATISPTDIAIKTISPTSPSATTAPVSTATNITTAKPTVTPKDGQIYIPSKILYHNGKSHLNYTFKNNSLYISDHNNDPLIEVNYNEQGIKIYEKKYEFSFLDSNTPIKHFSYIENFYSEYGTLISAVSYKDSTETKILYHYNNNANLIKTEKFVDEILVSNTIYSYYNNNKIYSEITTDYFYDEALGNRKEILNTIYNYQGNAIERKKTLIRDNFNYEKILFNYKYEYDDNNFVTKQHGYYNASGTEGVLNYRYNEFDKLGNITKQIIEPNLYNSFSYYDNFGKLLLQYRQENENSKGDISVFNPLNNENIIIKDVYSNSNYMPESPSYFYINDKDILVLKNPKFDGDYNYNSNGELVNYSYSENNLNFRIKFDYSTKGLLEKEYITVYQNSNVIENFVISHFYDDNNKIILSEHLGNKFHYKDNQIIKIETNDNLIVTFEYENDLLFKKTLSYNKILIVFDYENNSLILNTLRIDNVAYFFNDKGQLIKEEVYKFNNDLNYKKEYIFDDYGLVVKDITTNENGIVTTLCKYEYENNIAYLCITENYDINGNLLNSYQSLLSKVYSKYMVDFYNDNLCFLKGYDSSGNLFEVEFDIIDLNNISYKDYLIVDYKDLVP